MLVFLTAVSVCTFPSSVQVIRREVEKIQMQSLASEEFAQDIINYAKSTWPGIITCVKSYQTIRVLLNHKAHLIEELKKNGFLTEQVITQKF